MRGVRSIFAVFLLGVFFFGSSGPAHALYADGVLGNGAHHYPVRFWDDDFPVALRVGVGMMSGMSHEIVYDTDGRKLSELKWEIENVIIGGAELCVTLADWAEFNIGVWSNINEGYGEMDDRDWLDSGNPEWTDWSHHNVDLERAVMVDVNFNFRLWYNDWMALKFIVGGHHDSFEWYDRGSRYIYSSDPTGGGFRDLSGTLPAGGIDYSQWFYVPYIGLGLDFAYGDWSMKLHALRGAYGYGKGEDFHNFRSVQGLKFVDEFYDMEYLNVGGELDYLIEEDFRVYLSVDYQRYDREIGEARVEDLATGAEATFNDAAGIRHEAMAVMVGFNVEF